MVKLDLSGTVSAFALTPVEAIARDAKRRLGLTTRAERKAWLLSQMGRCVFDDFGPSLGDETQRKLAVLSGMSMGSRTGGSR